MLKNIFLAPVSTVNYDFQFLRPVIQGIDIKEVKSYTSIPSLSRFRDGKVYLWGVKEYKKRFWDLAKPDDIILFYNTGRFIFSAIILEKEYNEDLANSIWGGEHFIFSRKKNAWPFIFFLRDIHECDIPFEIIRQSSGYSPKYYLRSFIMLKPEARDRILLTFNSIDNFLLSYSKLIHPENIK